MSTPKILSDQILDELVHSEFPSGWDQDYMPEGTLKDLITEKSIILEFSGDSSFNGQHNDDKDLLDFILSSARKVLATCLLAGVDSSNLHKAMMIFRSHAFDDKKLPIRSPRQVELPWSELSWSGVQLRNFEQHQWKFLVPVFRSDGMELKLEKTHILPFKLVSHDSKEGAFSNVWEVAVHDSHLKEPMLKVRL